VWNEAHYNNKQLDSLIDASGSELNTAKRKALYKQIEVLISNDGPSIIPFFSTFVFAGTAKLKGFQPLPDTFHYFKTAWLSS
jgi:peptide/nickel transport system substrate-binding protein